MKCPRALLLLAAGSVLFGATASDGQPATDGAAARPFGLRQGMSIAELGAQAADIGGGMYKLTSVPLPHPDFEFYVAQVSPRTGLCYVKGVSKTMRTSESGAELQSRFAQVRDQVSAVYGRYRGVDLLLSDSMWVGPRDWMAALADRERLLFAHWNVETRANLGPHLTNVYVGARAKTSEAGYLVVEYYFDNEPGCQREIDNAATAALSGSGPGTPGPLVN